MSRHGCARLGVVLALGALGLAAAGPASRGEGDQPETVKIGLVKSIFRDVPAPMVAMLAYPFNALMKAQTGMSGQLVTAADCYDLGHRLRAEKVQLGVFHGVEFAWAREKYKDLRPLCIAVNRHRHLYAHMVVREDSPARQVADLKGKVVAVAMLTKGHCHVFLEHECAALGQTPAQFFGRIARPANIEAALDDVLRNKVQAALVDEVSMECYEQVKPGCYARLRVLKKSSVFPAGVIAYREGSVESETLDRFKSGMITANQNERGRELMSMWKLTAFEAIPADYEQTLAAALRAYPAPASPTAVPTGQTGALLRPE